RRAPAGAAEVSVLQQSRTNRKPPSTRALHQYGEGLLLVRAAVRNERPRQTGAFIARKMRNFRRDQAHRACLDDLRSLSFDLDHKVTIDRKQEFLGPWVHVPRRTGEQGPQVLVASASCGRGLEFGSRTSSCGRTREMDGCLAQ